MQHDEVAGMCYRYPILPAGLTIESGGVFCVLSSNVCNYTSAAAADSISVCIEYSESPLSKISGDSYRRAKDFVWTVDCTNLNTAPVINWPEHCYPSNEEYDLLLEPNSTNVFFCTEFVKNYYFIARKIIPDPIPAADGV